MNLVAEKLAALMTAEYLDSRGARGKSRSFQAALKKVRDVPPDTNDQLPPKKAKRTTRR